MESDLVKRLEDARSRIAAMCREHRGPRMTIPVDLARDDDVVICAVLKDAADALSRSRDEALEEAAKAFDGFTYGHYEHPSITIRALKTAAQGEGKPYKKGDPAGKCGLCEAPLMWYVPHTCARLAAAQGEK